MKPTLTVLALLTLATTSLLRAEDPAPANTPSAAEKLFSAVQGKATDAMEASQKSIKKAQEKADAIFKRQNDLLTKQEADTARFEKILDTWEKQQAQYQLYLDSLTKK